ncbi:hypothetical protein [Aquifex aeolicus]|uniref:Uncharacterized protein aq_1465 n=1 Tax=Aquifex aeolicus (strain VF5) TaxID=224324 RepID=Y1465_AQUAE|nr:hypothetical protein [Aquifex aeolicus]O67445.1 RecName: Full=Uncharacterized protein aq_1465; Flags: Precursor [Aquifex aeolicus VF5]AAC07404.1 putative protein [Aquifex aeolicus VF5]
MINRKVVYALSALLLFVYSYAFISDFSEFKNFLNIQYLKFKEFLFLLNNAEEKRRGTLNEDVLRQLTENLELVSIRYEYGKYEVKLRKVNAVELVSLLKELENYGKVEKLEAVDNTGRGIFDVKFIVSPL